MHIQKWDYANNKLCTKPTKKINLSLLHEMNERERKRKTGRTAFVNNEMNEEKISKPDNENNNSHGISSGARTKKKQLL